MARKCTDDIPKLIIDQSAQTIEEMMQEIPRGSAWMIRTANNMVVSGKWEKVWKRAGIRLVPAYRPTKGRK